jgi:hypothetical protein
MKWRGEEDLLLCLRAGECNCLDEACGNDECAGQFCTKRCSLIPQSSFDPFFVLYSIQSSMKMLATYYHRPPVPVLVVVSPLESPTSMKPTVSCILTNGLGSVDVEGFVCYCSQPGNSKPISVLLLHWCLLVATWMKKHAVADADADRFLAMYQA